MALSDMFLLLESKRAGVVKGESVDKTYTEQIDITGWSWGMDSATALGGTTATGRTALSHLRLSKRVDAASTALMSVMRSNDEIKKAVLTVRKSGGKQIDYFVLTVENGRIVKFEINGHGGPEMTEELSIAFKKMKVEYHVQDEKGARKGASTFETAISEV